MIEKALSGWHEFTQGLRPLRELLDEDCTFVSPVVFTPQQGRDITELYLTAAHHSFSGGADHHLDDAEKKSGFRYVREVVADPYAILEFEAEIDGVVINGVDMITANEAGKIVEFKVMVRPLQGMNKLHELMGKQLAALSAAQERAGE